MRKIILILPLVLMLTACGEIVNYENLGPATIYNMGYSELQKKNYSTAAENFAQIERNHPYSSWATRGLAMTAYASYLDNQYADAIYYADVFTNTHPGSQLMPYMLYLKAMSYYMQIPNVQRDQSNTIKAMEVMNELLKRFPNSPYAEDVKTKLEISYNYLAGQEMEIGRKALSKRDFIGAINRFQMVIKNYDTTAQTPEALYRLIEAHLLLGISEQARPYAVILDHNYPDNEWNARAKTLIKI